MYPGIELRLRPRCDQQSGEGFTHSITSDCLSRLEGNERTNFSEDIIREVSGNMFAGKLVPRPVLVLVFLTVGYSCSHNGMSETQPDFTVPP